MKVLFFINYVPPQYGGGYLRVFKIASRFKRDGILYKIMTCTKKCVYNKFLNVTAEDCVFYKNKFCLFFLSIYFLVINRRKFDVLYVASSQWYTVVPVLVCKCLRKRVVVGITLSQVDSPAVYVKGLVKRLYYQYKNLQFHFADFLFVNSPLLYDECINCGFEAEKVKLINNPVDVEVFHPVSNEECQSLKNEIGIDNTYETYLFVGSINNRKGANLFPQIFSQLFKCSDKKINFIICGQDGYSESQLIIEEIEAVFRENGSRFFLRKEVSDVHKYYKAADIFIFPTTNEGMPNVVLEAMASGCMIICSNLRGITDYVLAKDFLIENNDIDFYVERILDYRKNRSKYQILIQNNISLIERDFSIRNVDDYIKSILFQ